MVPPQSSMVLKRRSKQSSLEVISIPHHGCTLRGDPVWPLIPKWVAIWCSPSCQPQKFMPEDNLLSPPKPNPQSTVKQYMVGGKTLLFKPIRRNAKKIPTRRQKRQPKIFILPTWQADGPSKKVHLGERSRAGLIKGQHHQHHWKRLDAAVALPSSHIGKGSSWR